MWLLATQLALLAYISNPVSGFFGFGSSSSKVKTKKPSKKPSVHARSGGSYLMGDTGYEDVGYGAFEEIGTIGHDPPMEDQYKTYTTSDVYTQPDKIENRWFSKSYHKEKGHDDHYGHDHGYGHDHHGYGHDDHHGGYGHHDDYGKSKSKEKGGHKSWWKSWTSKGKGHKSKGYKGKGKKGGYHSYTKAKYKEVCYLVPDHDYGHDSGWYRR